MKFYTCKYTNAEENRNIERVYGDFDGENKGQKAAERTFEAMVAMERKNREKGDKPGRVELIDPNGQNIMSLDEDSDAISIYF